VGEQRINIDNLDIRSVDAFFRMTGPVTITQAAVIDEFTPHWTDSER